MDKHRTVNRIILSYSNSKRSAQIEITIRRDIRILAEGRRRKSPKHDSLFILMYSLERGTRTFPFSCVYHTGQSGPQGFLGGPGAFQEQPVLEIVTRTAGHRVRRRTLGAPRFLCRHAGRQHHRIDETETVAVATRLAPASRRARVPPLALRPRPSRPHIIIIAPICSRLVPNRSSFLSTTLDDASLRNGLLTRHYACQRGLGSINRLKED